MGAEEPHVTMTTPAYVSDVAAKVRALSDEGVFLLVEDKLTVSLSLPGASKKHAAPKPPTPVRPAPAPPSRGDKRNADVIASQQQDVLAHIQEHPGQGAEKIAKALDLTTKVLTLPIRKLLAAGKIRAEGRARSTAYFPVTDAASDESN